MARLMDLGLEKLSNMLIDMSQLSEKTVNTAIQAYTENKDLHSEIYRWSEELRMLQDEVSELAIELIALYQPMASDLRFIKSAMEIAYGFSRFGRYALDISDTLKFFGDISHCDHSTVERMGEKVKGMIKTSIEAFISRDSTKARTLKEKDDEVDEIYTSFIQETANKPGQELKCSLSATLILRYLERIADHAQYIGESIIYTATGERTSRR